MYFFRCIWCIPTSCIAVYRVCIVVHGHVSLPVPGALVCYCIQPVSIHADVSTFFNTGRYGVEYMCQNVSQCVYQMYRESLGNLESWRYLSGISARLDDCAVSRPPGPTYPYYAYYPYYCILPLPPSPTSYYTPTTPTYYPYYPY